MKGVEVSTIKLNSSAGGAAYQHKMERKLKEQEQLTEKLAAALISVNKQLRREIAERKRIEEALRGSKTSFHNIVENNSDGIVIINREGIVRFINSAAVSLFGRKKENFLGELFGFPLVTSGMTEVDIIRNGGETGTAEMRVDRTEWEGETAYLASLRDITERKRAEEAKRELDRMKSEFISNVSHELRSPLHSIKGFAKLLVEGKVPDPESQKDFLNIVHKESEHLGSLVDDLLDMSRLESSRFSIQKKHLSITNTIHESAESMRSLASEKGLVIIEDIPTTLPEVKGDEERLRQVMLNLLSNAIKFSNNAGSVTVRSEVKDDELLVEVIDHGIGISKEAMTYLFERFYRASDPMARGGTGLGLYISKQIIDAHGGHIWVKSKEGEGSTFSFTLPLD